jgi:hypothetical protein
MPSRGPTKAWRRLLTTWEEKENRNKINRIDANRGVGLTKVQNKNMLAFQEAGGSSMDFVRDAAAFTAISLFVAMVGLWSDVIRVLV